MNSAKFGSSFLLLLLYFIIVQSGPQTEHDYVKSGYRKVSDGFYKLHTNLATWEEANQICESEHANLAVLNDHGEADILMKLWHEAPPVDPEFYHPVGKYVYLGIHDRNNEDKWQSIFGEQLRTTGFAVWGRGEPNSYMGLDEDCGTFDVRTKTLNDISCERKLRFLCERADPKNPGGGIEVDQ